MKDCKIWIFLCILCLVIGFLSGRKTMTAKETIKYIPGEAVRGNVNIPDPVESIPDNPIFPTKPDTVYIENVQYVFQVVDTAAIIADYIVQREYTPVLFDNPTAGKLSLSATVQYNKLENLRYEFFPIVKEVTKYRERVWTPYVSGSINTFNQVGIGGGLFYHDIGVDFSYIRDLNENKTGYGVGLRYKF